MRKMTTFVVCWIVAVVIVAGPRIGAAQSVKPEVLQELKAATVYIKVKRRTFEWTGSGLVLEKNNDFALIITNSHVLQPPKFDDADAKDIPRETMQLIIGLQRQVSGVASNVEVVFHSGMPQERTLAAEVVADDSTADLAVLKVTGAPATAKPVGISKDELVETTPLIALGYPFGGLLAVNKANPAITISRAELTSFKEITEGHTWLQLQGALNPGSSGGPVVDLQGKLCGVQVAAIRGAGLGFAIPAKELTSLMRGRITRWRMAAKKTAAGEAEVEYRTWVIDPATHIAKIMVNYIPGETRVVPVAQFKSSPTELIDSKSAELTREGQWAVARFTIPIAGPGPLVATVQPAWTDKSNNRRLALPEVVRISLGSGGAVGPDDGRTYWRYVDPRKGEGWTVKTKDGWSEEDDAASHHFVEVGRNANVVEMYDAQRKIRLQVFHDHLMCLVGNNKKWIRLYTGAWEAAGDVIAAE